MSATQSQVHRPWWVPQRQTREELIDQFDQPMDDLIASFRDIRIFNRLFGGTSLIFRHLETLLSTFQGDVELLDVATGLGDIPHLIVEWGFKRGRRIFATGLDANENALRLASSSVSDVRFVSGDARQLPFYDDSFDIALCTLTIHHFDDATAAQILREMARVSRHGFVVNDLRRSYLPAALIWMICRVFGMSRLSKHDAHLSVLRSRTMAEYRRLVELSGLPNARVYKGSFWRAAIVWRPA